MKFIYETAQVACLILAIYVMLPMAHIVTSSFLLGEQIMFQLCQTGR